MYTATEDRFDLILVKPEHILELVNWHFNEKRLEYFTCRPLASNENYEDFIEKLSEAISNSSRKSYVLVEKNAQNIPLGKINLFDYNPRNHSAEFGYYFPEGNRKKGFGSIMLKKFLNISFGDEEFSLNKLYATTASNNAASISLLKKFNFHLDGIMREHYWIDSQRYDQHIYSMLKREWKK